MRRAYGGLTACWKELRSNLSGSGPFTNRSRMDPLADAEGSIEDLAELLRYVLGEDG